MAINDYVNSPVLHAHPYTTETNQCFHYMCDTLGQLQSISPNEGDMGYVKDTHRMYFYDGTVWRQIRY